MFEKGSIELADESLFPVGIGASGVQISYETTIIKANIRARNRVIHFIDTVIVDGLVLNQRQQDRGNAALEFKGCVLFQVSRFDDSVPALARASFMTFVRVLFGHELMIIVLVLMLIRLTIPVV